MRTGVWLLAVVALAGTLLVSIHSGWINGNLLSLLPQPDRNADVASALGRVQQSTVNQILVLTQAKRADAAARAARAYARALHNSGLFQQASAGLPLNPQAASRFYRRYRFRLLTRAQRRMLRRTSIKTLTQRAVRRAYAAPGEASGQEIATDPLGLFRNALQTQLPQTGWRIDKGTLVRRTSHGYAGVVHGALAISPFSLGRQRALRATLNKAAQAARQTGPSVQLLTAGVVWHALAQSRQARWEISTIGLGSMIAVVALIIAVFRSLRPLLIGVLSLATGCLAALCATELLFGQVYLFTLVFGASLIGVAIDYDLHVFADRFAGERYWSARKAIKQLFPGLSLALTTSVLGYAALALTPLPGLRQIAFFSVVGLMAAWASVVLLAPAWGGGGRRTRQPPRLAQRTDRALARLYRQPVATLLLLGALCAPGWLGVHFSDDVAALRTPLPQRDAMEHHVRKLLGAADENQFFLVTAPDAPTLLQREADLGHKLDRLSHDGVLRRWRGLVQQVPPPARQRRNYQLLANKVFGPRGAAPRAWRRLGFSPAHIARQQLLFQAAATRQLTLQAWLKSPASRPLRHLWLGTLPDADVGTIVLLGGIEDSAALNQIHQPGVQWVDPVADLTAVLATQRRHIGVFLLLAYLLVGLVLARVYGKWGGLRAILPPAAASAAAVSALGWAGEPLDLFALFALLLVLGIGVDYTIFLREAGRGRHLGAWSAVGMSAITTALAFGLLALSQTPAIHRFGFTLLIGIGVAWLLAPLARARGSNATG